MGEEDASNPNLVRVGRELTVDGRVIVVRLEPPLWQALDEVCHREASTLEAVIALVEQTRGALALAEAIPAYLTRYFKEAAIQDRPRRGLSESANDDSIASGPLAGALDVIGPRSKR